MSCSQKRAAEAEVTDVRQLAGIESGTFHDLRRTFISDLLNKGVDVATVAKLAGHSNPQTTLRYDRRKMETRRRAVSTLHVPYHRREKVA